MSREQRREKTIHELIYREIERNGITFGMRFLLTHPRVWLLILFVAWPFAALAFDLNRWRDSRIMARALRDDPIDITVEHRKPQ